MRLVPALILLVLSACVDARVANVPSDDKIRFLVTVEAAGRVVGEARGPFLGTEALPRAIGVGEGLQLLVLEIDEARLALAYPAYDRTRRAALSLVPTTSELTECAEGGYLEGDQRLVVPLVALGEGVLASVLGEANTTEPSTVPPELALGFEAKVCGRGSTIRLSPFGADSSFLAPSTLADKPARTIDLIGLDTNTVIAVSNDKVMVVRRGGLVELERDTLSITQMDLSADVRDAWEFNDGALAPSPNASGERDLILSCSFRKDRGLQTFNSDAGGALVHLTIDANHRMQFRRRWIAELNDAPESLSLNQVHIDAMGRVAAVGRNLVATSTAPNAAPRFEVLVGFDAQWILPLGENGAAHIVGDGNGQVFEGDVFNGLDEPNIYAVANVADSKLNAASRLDDETASIVGVGIDGRVWQRAAKQRWAPYPLDFPPIAATCSGAMGRCGRRQPGSEPHRILGVKGNNGVLVGTRTCTALFWRTALDGCAGAAPVLGDDISVTAGRLGVGAILEHEGHLLAAAGIGYLYEVELELEP